MQIKRLIIVLMFAIFCLQLNAQSVGLVFSGGGARGLSHIGVIKALEEYNIPIDYVSGTSMGAIVAGLYAIGLTPDEMVRIFATDDFLSWFKGLPEQGYATYYYKPAPRPDMLGLSIELQKRDDKFDMKLQLPTSLVSPYPMDFAVMQIFSAAGAVAGGDFDRLMVPFFCIASDIAKKKPYVARSGDLGSAVRASMTYPLYFKPIIIDSILLFDGGLYDNFPWEKMSEIYDPDVIIGVKCSSGQTTGDLSENDLAKQIETMLMVDQDYSIPEDKGVFIEGIYDFGIMDFYSLNELVEQGYQNALKMIPELKRRIAREMTAEENEQRRLEFRMKVPRVMFNKIEVEGDLSASDKRFIINSIANENDSDDKINFSQAKRGYYRVIASGTVKNFYPYATFNEQDSLFTLHLRTTKNNDIDLRVGANISSSVLNQGYIGISYTHLNVSPWRVSANLDVGHFYTGLGLEWRHDFSFDPLAFYEIKLDIGNKDYSSSHKNTIISDDLSRDVQMNQTKFTFNLGIPLIMEKNILAKIGFDIGENVYDYYDIANPSKYDTKDRTKFRYISPRILIERNTHNYKMYASEGKREFFSIAYTSGGESHTPGTTSGSTDTLYNVGRSGMAFKFQQENYYRVNRWFSLGYSLDIAYSGITHMNDYMSTLMQIPAYRPTIHSKTVLLSGYSSPAYYGIGVIPVINFSPSVMLHTSLSYFQPFWRLEMLSGGEYKYSNPLPGGDFIAHAALAWHSPIGVVSISLSYYNGEEDKARWYPQFNLGFLIF